MAAAAACARHTRFWSKNSSGALELVYFNADPAYLRRLLPVGSRRLISGKVEAYDGWLQMPHPDHVVPVDERAAPKAAGANPALPLLEPVYGLTAGLTNTTLRKAVTQALARLPKLPEWNDAAWRQAEHMASLRRCPSPHAWTRGTCRSRVVRAGTDASRL